MTTIAVLLVAGALTTPPNAAPPAAQVGVNSVSVFVPADAADQDVRRRAPQRRGETERSGEWGERPHHVGVGGSIMVSNHGATGGFRYWFGDRVGVNVAAGWHGNGGRTNASSSVVVLPSVVVMLTKPEKTGAIDIRPYVGGGVNYARMSGATPVGQRQSGAGYQVFGGAEITLREMDSVTFSGEGIYYAVPSNYLNAPMSSGFTYGFAVHFYLK